MSTEPLHLFLNPTAGRGRAGRREARIREMLRSSGLRVEVHRSCGPGDLEQRVEHQVEQGSQHIVVMGGDGSVHEAVNGIVRAGRNAALGLIPSGTGNDFAKACGVPLDWERAVRLVAERVAAGQGGRTIDVGRMNDRYFANGAGIGFDARVTAIAHSYRVPIGDLVYLLGILQGMAEGIATPRMRLVADDVIWDGPLTLANVANGPWVGGMFHIAPMADPGDGWFDLMLAAPVSRRRILSLLPALMRGRHVGEPEIVHTPVTRLVVEADEPVVAHLDGELQSPQRRFDIELLPGALQLL
ncbi:MAG: diacylglycerol kinase family lipid kinase [Woeseiaceae bacterium]|jgi:diacylglycerol kinase (ATP)